MLQLTIGEVLVFLAVALIFVGVGLLVRRYPTTISGISTLKREERDKLDLHKIGRFVSRWMYVVAATIVLSLLIPYPKLRAEAMWMLPLFEVVVCYAYLIKYKRSRFSKEVNE